MNIILFTYIPGISARSIGLSCQKQRLKEYIKELNLTSLKTGNFVDILDLKSINQDSLLCEKYKDVCSVIDYIREDIGADKFKQQYGNWEYTEYNFFYEKNVNPASPKFYAWHQRATQVELGNYSIMLPHEGYDGYFLNGVYFIKRTGGDVVLEYPINIILKQDTTNLDNLDRLMTYKNDSLMLILERFCIVDTITNINNDFMLFKKSED